MSIGTVATTMVSFDDAFRDDVEPYTGGWSAESSKVKRRISQLIGTPKGAWIGITSNGKKGCRARWNDKYKGKGMKHMAAVYMTTSESFRRDLEIELIKFFKDWVDNLDPGGGGPDGTPPFMVYVAWA